MRDKISIAGGWLGTYRWGGLHAVVPPVRFEASITVSDEGFSGEILDAAYPGLAMVVGNQHGREVRFTKTYTAAPAAERTMSADYQGELAEDGDHVKGTWRIKVEGRKISFATAHGTWEARRMWNENAEENERADTAAAEIDTTQTAPTRVAR
jgi:hypothetical protein